ncbi:MAG TPA: TetR/AcrR family transcriptional regulator [Acidimicrobiales bacterium]|jgi:AcrR family transcriptional regulator
MTVVLADLLSDRESGDGEHERVLDAALSAFLDFGIRRTSMGEIAKRSAISPATLYRRFAGKDDVVWAVGRREARQLILLVDREVDPAAPAEDQVVSMFVAFLQGLRNNRLLSRLLATEPEVVLPLLTIHGGPALQLGRAYLADFIRRLQEQGQVRRFDPDPVAEMVARVALSMALTPQTCIPVDDERAARDFARQHVAAVLGVTGSGSSGSRSPSGTP